MDSSLEHGLGNILPLLSCAGHEVEDNEMSVSEYCVRKVVTARPDETVRTAAQRMADYEVGALVITEDAKPVGIVTDRDLVLWVVTKGDDPQTVTLNTVMTPVWSVS